VEDESEGWPPDDYVHFDEQEDVLASLALLRLLTPLVSDEPIYWKWMIIAADNALQGAMVCALVDTTGTLVLRKDSRREMLDWLNKRDDARGAPPKEKLDYFSNLLDQCVSTLGLSFSGDQLKDVRRLHDYFRNNFAHFTPKGWGIEKGGLPRMIGAALYAVEYLMGCQGALIHLDGRQRVRLRASLEQIRTALRAIPA
jgi:hypothetical protein